MGPALYVMAILGCGEADACQPVAVVPARYETMAECAAATPGEVERHADIDYAVVVAQCVKAGTKAAMELMPKDIELPDAPQPRQGVPAARQASLAKGAARS